MKERLDELDGIDKSTETKLKSRHNGSNPKTSDYLIDSDPRTPHSEPYVYKMRTRQRTNTIEPAALELPKSSTYQMRTRNRSNSSDIDNDTSDLASRSKRPITIHESLDNSSPVSRRIYQRSLSCDRNKANANAILKDSAKILGSNDGEAIPSPIQSFRRTNSLRQPMSFDKKEYRRSLSTNSTGYVESARLDRYVPSSNSTLSSLERVLSPTRKVSRFLRSSMYEPSELSSKYSPELTNVTRSMRESSVGLESSSRIKNTIRSLRESSVGPEPSIDSESNLIKRAISLESKNSVTEPRSSIYRTHSLKQNSTNSKNVYKDFINKIVNSRDGTVSRSIFNEKNLPLKSETSQSIRKREEPTNIENKTSPDQISDTQKEKEENKNEMENANNVGTPGDLFVPRYSRFLKSGGNEKPLGIGSGSKLPTRLTPNSEPILLKNRRYSIPRSNATNKEVTDGHATESVKNINKKHETSPVDGGNPKSNGHISENGIGTQSKALMEDEKYVSKDTKDDNNALENVEKVINNLENAQKNSRAQSISNLKRLDLSKIHPRDFGKHEKASTSRSLDHCDNSSRCSFLSPTEDSDGWSVCSDVTDIRGDCPSPSSPSSAHEETVSERIRRKSFFSRFNPRKNSAGDQMSPSSRVPTYARSSSAENPSPSLLKSKKSFLKTREP
ncbi:hypothetical protein M8J75_015176 [Diaphorina citri]|nr:hypothetical protein M8J75_015176 [Diaphorina citri]